ncbi:MAG: penicillin acylase family protein [Bacteriovoracia bacterium]
MFYLILAFLTSAAFAQNNFECKTQYGELDIPYVETSSLEEKYYCFGFHHGKDRAWEMDYFRRVAEGRNAEIHGFAHLKSDLMMRLLDLPSEAKKIWNGFSPEQKRWLEIYAEGVNKGFETGKTSFEFRDLEYAPEPWKPEHSLLVLLLQSFDQTRKTFITDYEEEKTKYQWGESASALFDEDDVPWNNTILKSGEYPKKESIVKTSFVSSPKKVKLWEEFPTLFGQETGSNNWAVSKDKSKTGKAIFANDPHLDLKTPMFWYWISLTSPEGKIIGGSVPGVPVIASGTNGKVVWGLTNSYLKSADAVFVKDVKDEDIETIRPTVYVKFLFFKIPFFFKSFEKLKTGHRVLPLDVKSDDKLVLRWTGFSLTPEDFYPMFNLASAKDVSEMEDITSRVGVPSWNFVFADRNGDIGYRVVGKTYKHEEKLPLGIRTLTLAELTDEKFLESDEKPHVLKPVRNYVYSANNRHWPSDARFYGGRGYKSSFRASRIDELLVKDSHTVETFKNIQCDRQVVDARYFAHKLQKYLDENDFKKWSMVAEDKSKALPVYRRLMDILMENWQVNEYALFRMLDKLTEMQINELKSYYKLAVEEVDGRKWGQLHRLQFPHLSKNASWKFSPEIAGVGDTHSVDPGTAIWNSDKKIYEQSSGASMRLIVEMGDVPKIWLALPGLNRQYDQKAKTSPWKMWKNCEYTEVKF